MNTSKLLLQEEFHIGFWEKVRMDWLPLALVPALIMLGAAFIGAADTWLTLTINGLATGMIIFIIASGLTLIFGLMDVFNFGHGLFITAGAYLAFSVLGYFPEWSSADSLSRNLAVVFMAVTVAVISAALIGWVFERVLVKRAYGQSLTQILVTMGGMVVGEELIKIIWGTQLKVLVLPAALGGSINLGDSIVFKYRIFAVLVGLAIFAAMMLILNRTKLGLLIRAGVQNREMVECFGYPVRTLFVGVFVAGSALAGLGGVMWGMDQQLLFPQTGSSINTVIFIVIIIGGLGSTGGAFLAALLVGLLDNYMIFISPKMALVSNILLLACILAWRPNGLYQVGNR